MAEFDVHATAYGRAAVDLLAAQIKAAKSGDPLGAVTVIVPSNYAAVATDDPATVLLICLEPIEDRMSGPWRRRPARAERPDLRRRGTCV